MEKAMAPHSSTLAWKIPWTEEHGGLQSMGSRRSDTTEQLHFHFSLSCTGEGNGNPLQCSCLENPRDGGAWWAAVYGVTQSRTRLKRLSSSSSVCLTFFYVEISYLYIWSAVIIKIKFSSQYNFCFLLSFLLWSSFKKEKRQWFKNLGHTLYRACTHWKVVIAHIENTHRQRRGRKKRVDCMERIEWKLTICCTT